MCDYYFQLIYKGKLNLIIILLIKMATNTSYTLHKKKYTQISVKKRKLLVQLVLEEGKTLSEAGRKLHINPSTVRLIIKKYKQTGTFFMKKLRNTPKESKPAPQDPQNDDKDVVNQGQLKPNKERIPVEEPLEPKCQASIKIQEPKASPMEWYYPFLQYGFRY